MVGQDLERCVEAVASDRFRPGRSAAFAVPVNGGTEEGVAVVAEVSERDRESEREREAERERESKTVRHR